jgi:hypothetical protein
MATVKKHDTENWVVWFISVAYLGAWSYFALKGADDLHWRTERPQHLLDVTQGFMSVLFWFEMALMLGMFGYSWVVKYVYKRYIAPEESMDAKRVGLSAMVVGGLYWLGYDAVTYEVISVAQDNVWMYMCMFFGLYFLVFVPQWIWIERSEVRSDGAIVSVFCMLIFIFVFSKAKGAISNAADVD